MISFHWSYLILIVGFLGIPIMAAKISGDSDRYGIGALIGGIIGCFIFMFSLCIFMALKLWVLK